MYILHLKYQFQITSFLISRWTLYLVNGKTERFFFENYKMIYLKLISSLKWRYDYVFLKKKIKNGKQNARKAI